MERSPFEPKPRDENGPEKPQQAAETTPEKKTDAEKQEQKKHEQVKKKLEKERKKQQKKQVKQAEEIDKKERPPKKVELSEEEKQERRDNLVEQSAELVEEHEHEPAPQDPTAVARLMLAHRVVNLQHQLKHPSNDKSALTPQEINATLDYIADLDEKFQDPELETTPEIEQAYHEILQHVESSLERDTPPRKTPDQQKTHTPDTQQAPDVKTIPKNQQSPGGTAPAPAADPNTTPLRREPAAPDTSQRTAPAYRQPAPVRPTPERPLSVQRPTARAQGQLAAASLIAFALVASRDKQPPKENSSDALEQPIPTTETPQEAIIATPRYAPADTRPEKAPIHAAGQEVQHPAHKESNESRTQPQETNTPTQDEPRAFASIATPPYTPRQTPFNHEASPPPAATFEHTPPPVERPKARETQPPQTDPEHKPKRKIEHLKLIEQLSMADRIYVGYGRYLRREFEAGHIDRSGLVKVLKAYTKGQDYHFEFRRQTERFTALKATSPEFLHLSRHTTGDTNQVSEEGQPDAHEPQSEHEQAAPLLQWLPWSNRRNKRSNSPLASKKQSAAKRLRRIIFIVFIGISLAALLITGALRILS